MRFEKLIINKSKTNPNKILTKTLFSCLPYISAEIFFLSFVKRFYRPVKNRRTSGFAGG
jgi:hypothetical protein